MGSDGWPVDEHVASLPRGGEQFLSALSREVDDARVESVLLFGSVVTGDVSEMSDVDVLVVLDDRVAPSAVAELQAACDRLARRHLDSPRTRPNRLERFVDRSTGMFRSGFVTTERAVVEGRFADIFGTSRLAYVLAPWRTTMYSVFDSAEPVAGSPVVPDWTEVGSPLDHQVSELLRSWLTTVTLATAQIPYRAVSRRAVSYSLEAFKWSAYTCAFHLRDEPAETLEEALATVSATGWYTHEFRRLRHSDRTSLSVLLATPLVVTLLHLRTLLWLWRRA